MEDMLYSKRRSVAQLSTACFHSLKGNLSASSLVNIAFLVQTGAAEL